ncbi:hypothetical protein [Cohnella rhizosphaerae]|uniref:Uncharacterized protein n=1 Tax=Cohnella rhizosphaerae TaxID=1457232 RepID=A0A9X4KW35_9BACL|nr:hypothetical protein [Cohnella rhizosphaerae]MDG0811553.1 hypothetical protein [Cohnella rhizosphaerae]
MHIFPQWLRQTGRRLREAPSRRLVNKLILLFTSIIILIVSSLTFIAYKIIERESVANSIASNRSNLKLVNQNYAKYMSELEQLSLPQIAYDPLMRAIEREGEDYASRLYLEDYLRSLFYARSDLQSIYLYLVDERKYLYVTRERYNVTVRAALDDGIPEQAWYKRAMADSHNRGVQSLVLSRETGYGTAPEGVYMAYHRVLRSLRDRQARAVLSFYVNDSAKNAIMADMPKTEGGARHFAGCGRHAVSRRRSRVLFGGKPTTKTSSARSTRRRRRKDSTGRDRTGVIWSSKTSTRGTAGGSSSPFRSARSTGRR